MTLSPVFSAIEAHRAAADELRALETLADGVLDEDTRDDKACDAGDRESAAFLAVLTTSPTTISEAIAVLIYVSSPSHWLVGATLMQTAFEDSRLEEAAGRFPELIAEALSGM
jgi:hypothetical protein